MADQKLCRNLVLVERMSLVVEDGVQRLLDWGAGLCRPYLGTLASAAGRLLINAWSTIFSRARRRGFTGRLGNSFPRAAIQRSTHILPWR